ncbi:MULTISPECIES: ChaB family protein [unclassified Streptomyces]|uniref:ChaB family protein n=1 Tax=unclassified Streptomyces TaxID=2593676 RepID=UPI0003A4CC4C|nr:MULTISPECIES: ChaB family protein [unclassified Streptomyces]MYS40910.1 cation transport regulator ChaB [Streptomyces sp. SID5998]MYX29483.1 cation transport regulator ChaB [Streptomyces sp. SID8381]MYX47444.1 cation transport regulator ChaB [Streptomyces sp. SID89]NED36498.1 cation transport regulator ChaB [Streptomyces sp. SID8499]NED71669.1 cation transport regulator ChaB [Streptomyces sp. SID9944]
MPGRQELPSTLERSSEEAQRTWIKAHDSAVETYGEGERAHRVAYGALKHMYEKVGDHWERKEGGRKGPSDPQSARPRGQGGRSGEGVDESASKEHLYDMAKRLDIEGRSHMSKGELLDAIRKANRSSTRRAREE